MGFDLRDLVLNLHIASVIFSVVCILFADKQAFAWLRGKTDTLDAQKLRLFHRLVFVGLLSLIATGSYLFWPMREYLLSNPKFIVKMVFVGLLFANAFVIGKLMSVATTRAYRTLSTKERAPLFLSGFVSTLAWLGAIGAGIYLFD